MGRIPQALVRDGNGFTCPFIGVVLGGIKNSGAMLSNTTTFSLFRGKSCPCSAYYHFFVAFHFMACIHPIRIMLFVQVTEHGSFMDWRWHHRFPVQPLFR